jgi:triacylglycerol lipase
VCYNDAVRNKLDFAVGVLNGLIGDYLARTNNGLATEMAFCRDGDPVPASREGLARAYPRASPRVAVLVHGILATEDLWAFPDGGDYGSLLERDLGLTALYVRYNSGLPIAENGAALADLLETLVDAYPAALEEIIPIGHSMGGLLLRSACHAARVRGHRWLSLVERAIYVGTPHLGSPIERAGRVVARMLKAVPDPYTRLIADVADLRSRGMKDLGDAAHPVPLLPEIRHYLVAASLATDPRLALLFGDVLVPVPSGTAGACCDRASLALPPEHVRVFGGIGHVDLAHHAGVYAQIRDWCVRLADCEAPS